MIIAWIVVSVILMVISLGFFLFFTWNFFMGDYEYRDMRGDRLAAQCALASLAASVLAWAWPVILPLLLLAAIGILVRGAFKKEEK